MSAAVLIEELNKLGVKLTPEGDRLRYRGPVAVVTPELKQRIADQKDAIITALRERRKKRALEVLGGLTAHFNELCEALESSGVSTADAEKLALAEVKKLPEFSEWSSLR
jgi:hypothetical protein